MRGFPLVAPVPTIKLTKTLAEKFIAAAAEAEVRDVATPGLVLRVRTSGRWSWTYRRTHARTDYRRDLGSDWTLDEARGLATELNVEAARRWPDVLTEDGKWIDWIESRRARRRGERYVPPPPPPAREIGETWRDAAAAWIAEVARTRREETADSYRKALNVRELRPLHDRLVSRLTSEDLAEAVAAITRRGKERQAQTSAVAIRGFWGWMGGLAQRRKYGVADGVMKGLAPAERTQDEKGDEARKAAVHVPSGPEIGRIVSWLREDHAPERDRLAALLLVYTAQRRKAVASARVANFSEVDGTPCWLIPPMHRKTASMRRRRGVDVARTSSRCRRPRGPSSSALANWPAEASGFSPGLGPEGQGTRCRTWTLP